MLPRTKRIMESVKKKQIHSNEASNSRKRKDEDILQCLDIPNYESTKGLSALDKVKAMQEYSSESFKNKSASSKMPLNISIYNSDSLPFGDLSTDPSFITKTGPGSPKLSPTSGDNFDEDPNYLLSENESESQSQDSTSINEYSTDISFSSKNKYKSPELSGIWSAFNEDEDDLLSLNESEEVNCVAQSSKNKTSGFKHSARNKVFCIYCEQSVDNFARHLARNHSMEIEVQKFLAIKKNCKERKQIIAKLRKQGNYFVNLNYCVRPVKKPEIATLSDYQPCEYCLGFYSRKSLWRHKKKCSQNKKDSIPNKHVLFPFKIDEELIVKVFPRMRPDNVSLVAKKDALICAFGSRYLKCHRDKHFIVVTSRKMRELSKLLIEVRKLDKKVTDLFEALRPQYYDTIVQATKNVSKYCELENTFSSPTFALNIKKSLKDCCNIAINFTLKEKHVYHSLTAVETESQLKTAILLLDNNWLYDISKQASNDINIKKWNKLTIIPLASDLKIFKNYLLKKGKDAAIKLESNPRNQKAYLDLLETVYCRVLLLNRRRPGELERMFLNTYLQSEKPSNYEEFSDVITPSEKILMKRFRRVVIRGKRGRGVPVLFSCDVQEHLELLNTIRPQIFENLDNPYLFGKPGYSTPIVGYKVLQKTAANSGAKNPGALTATRLRKHLATITQIFNMSESDIEQLATFMGHTDHIHRGEYRLPDDVFQTAKICKLLLTMEEGKAAAWKGKKLDEINVDMEENLLEIDSDREDELEELAEDNYHFPKSDENKSDEEEVITSRPRSKITPKKRLLIPWTPQQKQIVINFFKSHVKNKVPPKKKECEILISNNKEILQNKDWLKIKVFIQNIYKKLP